MPKSVLNITNTGYTDILANFSEYELTRGLNSYVYEIGDRQLEKYFYSQVHKKTYLFKSGYGYVISISESGQLQDDIELYLSINGISECKSHQIVYIAAEQGLYTIGFNGEITKIEEVEAGINHLVMDEQRGFVYALTTENKVQKLEGTKSIAISQNSIIASLSQYAQPVIITKGTLHGASGKVYWTATVMDGSGYSFIAIITDAVDFDRDIPLFSHDYGLPAPDYLVEAGKNGKIYYPGVSGLIFETDETSTTVTNFNAMMVAGHETAAFYSPGIDRILFSDWGGITLIETTNPYSVVKVPFPEDILYNYGYGPFQGRSLRHFSATNYNLYLKVFNNYGVLKFDGSGFELIPDTEDVEFIAGVGNYLILQGPDNKIKVIEVDRSLSYSLKDSQFNEPLALLRHGKTTSATLKTITLNAETELQLSNPILLRNYKLFTNQEDTFYPEDSKFGRKSTLDLKSTPYKLDPTFSLSTIIKSNSSLSVEFNYEPGL